MKFIISQILGAIGYSLLAFSYFRKNKKDILLIQILAYIGFTTHYILLSATTGTICNVLGFIALILIYLFSDNTKKKKVLVALLIPILIVMSYFSYENIFSVFPVIACLITFISFLDKDENKIRFVGIISAVCWLIYAVIHGSFIAILFEVITIVSTIIAYLKNKKNTK